jgi:hypothetical protein
MSAIDARSRNRRNKRDQRQDEQELMQLTEQRNRKKDKQRLATQLFGMIQTMEQSVGVGRIPPYTGRTARPLVGRLVVPHWAFLFKAMLLHMLPSSMREQLHVEQDISNDRDEIDIWDKREYDREQQITGAMKGYLNIVVRGGAPQTGCSMNVDLESDWRARICSTERMARVEINPSSELTHRIIPVDPPRCQTLRFKDFPCWEHSLSVRDGCCKLYHKDYNHAYAVLKLVSDFIKEHYLRRDMVGPDAPWDP